MTAGSWTYGNFGEGAGIAASKQWTGADGKTEAWNGGIRAKWNSYTLYHRRMSQGSSTPGRYVAPLEQKDISQIKSLVGWSNNDELRLLEKLAEQVRGHSFDLGVNMAEATKSYGTIVNNVQSIGSALWHLKHGRLGQASRVLGRGKSSQGILASQLRAKDLAGRWLETQYAFLPLVSQSYEAAKALESVTKPRPLEFRASSGTRRRTVDQTASPANYHADAHWTFSKVLHAELSEPLGLGRSLGLMNPLEIAWEVVPYSFVVDWFIPVGTYISAWGVIPALQGRFMTTERGAGKRGKVTQGTNPLNQNWILYAGSNRKETMFRMTRTPTGSLSIPRPQFNSLPRALSPKRLLSAISLIHQRLG